MPAPLTGIRVVEFAGMGPGPFATMLFADMGADVVRIDRPGASQARSRPLNPMLRGRRSVALDLKDHAAVEAALCLVESADVLIEGYRPGTMERLGLGPETCLERNAGLVYGRMTGWGQSGPLSAHAGHDLNYIALTGALDAIGRQGAAPTPPLNLLGDYAGGGLYLAFGVLSALHHARITGEGQVVDAAIVDGVAGLTATFQWFTTLGEWAGRGENELDSGAPYYDVYETADGGFVSVAALEPRFYAELRRLAGLTGPEWDDRGRENWPSLRRALAQLFRTRTRADWCQLFEDSDACVTPVLSFEEAPAHRHNVARGTFLTRDGMVQPAPAPRLSRTPGEATRPPAQPGQHTDEVLRELGFDDISIERLRGRPTAS